MCLAIPALVKSLEGTDAEVDISGVRRRISIYLTPEVKVGDYVLLHAGFSIRVVDQEEARGTLELLRQMDEASR
ncbi:MAG: HypC/HybG/HupF family hydrogenase formation chaperone [Dehalococcoidales bacterium]|nr:HypC/HybG/HupF family hydrogenase formation chaperone [Dehalococcoidales bacterium]